MRNILSIFFSVIAALLLPWWLVVIAVLFVSVAFESPFLFVFVCTLYLGVVDMHFVVLPTVILLGYATVSLLSKRLSLDLGRF